MVGSGGREHALCWAARRSPLVARVSAAPGNGGTAQLAQNHPLLATDALGLAELARRERVDLVLLGPDAAVEAGAADALEEVAVPCFGPTQAAGRLETSKSFAKELMRQEGIATPRFAVFDQRQAALDHLKGRSGAVVVKADGLALGKGAFVCASPAEAAAVVDRLLLRGELGAAGERLLIEDRIAGEEASFFAVCDGRSARMLPPARDYKRAGDGDLGPNTGGMGAFAPAVPAWRELNLRVEREVVLPVLAAMARRGTPYRGCLYVGAMLSGARISVLEFNARLGDPEAEVLLPLLPDLIPLLWQAALGRLRDPTPEPAPGCSVGVVAAREPYPEEVRPGGEIRGIPAGCISGRTVFQMSTRVGAAGRPEVAGGRVLVSTAVGPDLAAAREGAYQTLSEIHFQGMRYRRDIAAG